MADTKWPPDDFWGYPYDDGKEDLSDWKETRGRKWKCAKDSHKPADTGMRVSYCKECETKLVFVDWHWQEAATQ